MNAKKTRGQQLRARWQIRVVTRVNKRHFRPAAITPGLSWVSQFDSGLACHESLAGSSAELEHIFNADTDSVF